MTPHLLRTVRYLLPALFFAGLLASVRAQTAGPSHPRTPVLVELFTSEGCSSCPPADALLGRLEREQPVAGAEILILSEHVDYWDSLGWRDRFSSRQFTERQSAYAVRFGLSDVYTPQMVIGGTAQINGSDNAAALRAIRVAASAKFLPLEIADAASDGRHISATVRLSATVKDDRKVDLLAAVITPAATTEVRSGENGGHTLHHAGVVRSLQRIGSLDDLMRGPVTCILKAPEASGPLRLLVFAQEAGQGPILGVIMRPLPTLSPDSGDTAASVRRRQ